jgi:hypothetical protein
VARIGGGSPDRLPGGYQSRHAKPPLSIGLPLGSPIGPRDLRGLDCFDEILSEGPALERMAALAEVRAVDTPTESCKPSGTTAQVRSCCSPTGSSPVIRDWWRPQADVPDLGEDSRVVTRHPQAHSRLVARRRSCYGVGRELCDQEFSVRGEPVQSPLP